MYVSLAISIPAGFQRMGLDLLSTVVLAIHWVPTLVLTVFTIVSLKNGLRCKGGAMKTHKLKLLVIIVLFIFVFAISITLRSKAMWLRDNPKLEFSDHLEIGSVQNVTLTIYYLCPSIFSRPVSEDALKTVAYHYKVVVRGSYLQRYIELLRKMYEYEPTPVKSESPVADVRILYVFESADGRTLFRVSMWGDDESMYVNGVEVEQSDVFYDVLIQFLPVHTVRGLERVLNRRWLE